MVKSLKRMLALFWVIAAIGACHGRAGAAGDPPNILFILTDDHHHQALGAAGNPRVHTPRLDALAAGGAWFSQAVVASPQCTPSRASLLTGLFPHQCGVAANDRDPTGTSGRFAAPTAADRMREAGYHTALIGKWHLGASPGACGFAEVRLWTRKGQESYRDPLLIRGEEGTPSRRPGHVTDLLTEDALAFLRQNRDKRFFLWLAYTAPHRPIEEPREFEKLYVSSRPGDLVPPAHAPVEPGTSFDWGQYYAAITHLDQAIGRIIDELGALGLRERTLVAVLGDNGYVGGAFGHVGKVLPLEDSIRVPFILSLPGRVLPGAARGLASTLDLIPTWLDAAGLPPAAGLQGESLWPMVAGAPGGLKDGSGPPGDSPERPVSERAVFCEFSGDRAMFGPVDAYRLVRTSRHKYVLHRSGRERLFDLGRDPHELSDLSSDTASAALKTRLRALLGEWMRKTSDAEGLLWLARSSSTRF